jgi:dienelactone hydrolase
LRSFLTSEGVAAGTIDSLLNSALYALPAASPSRGPFPLTLVAQGNGGNVADQVVLCEYLASEGFVVATTPSPMIRTPIEREDQVGTFAETQASELAAAIPLVAASLPVDSSRMALVGHSFGARAALLLAMREERVRAIVSLDGGIGTASASGSFRTAPSFSSSAPIPPLLHFYENLDEFMRPDFTLLKEIRTKELVLEATEAMHHVHFSTYGFAAASFPELARVTSATPATGSESVRVLNRTADFLRRALMVR